MFTNISGLHGNLDELGVVPSKIDVIMFCETKVTRHRHAAELYDPGFCTPTVAQWCSS